MSGVDSKGRTIWIVDAHGYGKRFVVRSDEKLTAFLELESAKALVYEIQVDQPHVMRRPTLKLAMPVLINSSACRNLLLFWGEQPPLTPVGCGGR